MMVSESRRRENPETEDNLPNIIMALAMPAGTHQRVEDRAARAFVRLGRRGSDIVVSGKEWTQINYIIRFGKKIKQDKTGNTHYQNTLYQSLLRLRKDFRLSD